MGYPASSPLLFLFLIHREVKKFSHHMSQGICSAQAHEGKRLGTEPFFEIMRKTNLFPSPYTHTGKCFSVHLVTVIKKLTNRCHTVPSPPSSPEAKRNRTDKLVISSSRDSGHAESEARMQRQCNAVPRGRGGDNCLGSSNSCCGYG